jgi:hypothetical protein
MKIKSFTLFVYAAAVVMAVPGLFTFCSTSGYVEKPPSFSNTKLSDWQKFHPSTYAGIEKLLDTILVKEARQYYASLDEPYATIVMQRSFGNNVSQYPVQEWDKNFDKSGLVRMFSANDNYFFPFKGKVICICYYRHLRGLDYNFQAIKDSLIRRYPEKKTLLGGNIDFDTYYAEEDSISNDFYFKTWQAGDMVEGYSYIEGSSKKGTFSISYKGIIVAKDRKTGKMEIRITDLEVNKKKVLAFIDPKTKVETFAIGKTRFENPKNLTNSERKEQFRY